MKFRNLVCFFFALVVCSCTDTLRNGDLVFQVNDNSGFVDAIETATNRDGLSFSHVGIVYLSDTGHYIIEATPKHGVVATTIEDFLDDSAHNSDGNPMVKYYRVKTTQDLADKAVLKAISFIGTPYDFAFAQGIENIYCSELVYECFLDKDGNHIFPSQPMNFRDADGNLPVYWEEHFKKLGIPVPENEKGTNPNDMAQSGIIKALKIK